MSREVLHVPVVHRPAVPWAVGSMRTTTDTFTGRPFRWNTTVCVNGVMVPARITARVCVHLHPDRVPAALLKRLNP